MKDYAALVAETRKIEEKATPGPWKLRVHLEDDMSWLIGPRDCDAEFFDEDGVFIVKARTLVPELCDAITALIVERDTAVADVANADMHWHRIANRIVNVEAENAVLRAQVAHIQALPKKWREYIPEEYSPFDECADELDAALSKHKPKSEEK